MTSKIFKTNNGLKIVFCLTIFQFLISFNLILCEGCKDKKDLTYTSCYNDVITFNHNKWRAGHACTNLKGDVIVEFSLDEVETSKRLFYGLKENGRYYFDGEPVFKEFDYTVCCDCAADYNKKVDLNQGIYWFL